MSGGAAISYFIDYELDFAFAPCDRPGLYNAFSNCPVACRVRAERVIAPAAFGIFNGEGAKMAIFYGTSGNDIFDYYGDNSAGVTSDPPGLISLTDGGDLIYGFGGNDRIDSTGKGNNTIFGGDGDDGVAVSSGFGTVYGEAGKDIIQLGVLGGFADGGGGQDVIYGGNLSNTLRGGSGDDEVSGGISDDLMVGGAGADFLFGDEGADLIRGGAGDDTLVGDYYGSQKDTLIGGTGNDTFMFSGPDDSTPPAFDLIRGESGPGGAPAFEGAGVAGGDVIDMSQIDANPATGGRDAFVFGGHGLGQLWLTENGTRTVVLANTDGDGAAEFKLVIADGDVRASDYTADDFIL